MKQYFCVGTYSESILFGTGETFRGKGKGLYLCALENESIEIQTVLPLCNPSALTIDAERGRIYAVNETKEFLGHAGGGVSEIACDGRGSLRLLRQLPTGGGDPCHANLSPDGRALIVTNYAGGSVSVWPLDADGSIRDQRQLFQHTGGSVHPRQEGPHAHASIFVGPRAFVAVDLGKDALLWYDLEGGRAIPVPERDAALDPGSGPRTGALSRDGRQLYIVDELISAITRFEVRGDGLVKRETTPILPPGTDAGPGSNGGSGLHISPDGRTLYASHRGTCSLSAFRIREDAALECIANVPCGGQTPRDFAIDPTGTHLLCGNQDTDTISIFRLRADGAPEMIANPDFPTPVCIRFFRSVP